MPPENAQSIKQKKIAFAQNVAMVEGALAVLQSCMRRDKLVGDTEYATLVNAITMDAHAELGIQFMMSIERIKNGDLLTTESNG